MIDNFNFNFPEIELKNVSEFLENLEFSTDVYNGDAIVENDSIIEIEESN